MFSFLLRIFYVQGWYIVTYALAIYHLNLFLAFLTPKMDPAMAETDDEAYDQIQIHSIHVGQAKIS